MQSLKKYMFIYFMLNSLTAASQYIGAPKVKFAGRRADKLALYLFVLITQGSINRCVIRKN